jgi:hypothetical protein
MALKNWYVIHESKFMLRYKNKINDNILEIYPEKIYNNKLFFVAVSGNKKIMDKEFPSKPKAILFAKSYMRLH